jgi:trk system potassium uptake protein TrkH
VTTLDYSGMSDSTLLTTILLMFIGAGPGSTGGGIKVITAFVILLFVWTVVSNKEQTVIFKRTISQGVIYKSLIIFVMASVFVMMGAMALTITEDAEFLHLLFEVTSAFGTVGLSVNVTPTLSTAGKIIILVMMYIGRLGPLTLALAFAARQQEKANLKYPEGSIYVG